MVNSSITGQNYDRTRHVCIYEAGQCAVYDVVYVVYGVRLRIEIERSGGALETDRRSVR